jgi:hypothetical protein
MKKIVICVLIIAVITFTTCDLATLEFPPNQGVEISNPLLWKVKVSCTVHNQDITDNLRAKIIKGSATLNGQEITDGTQLEVKNGDNLTITATALGKFEITNLGENTVVTSCNLAFGTYQEIEYIQSLLVKNEHPLLKFLD